MTRVLAVCESPPTIDAVHGNGSTLIAHHVLSRLPDDMELRVVWFADRDVVPSPEVQARSAMTMGLALRDPRAALAAQALTALPRASWQRAGRVAMQTVAALARDADVAYVHGLHAFPLVHAVGGDVRVVVNEVDPWSLFWRDRASSRGGPRRWYDLLQARRAARLEAETARRADAYVVVNADDARALGPHVTAIPNGITRVGDVERTVPPTGRPVLAFVGTLDYAPNVDAARRLVHDVLPSVRGARVVIAGRRPTEEVIALADVEGVEVRADVPDVGEVFASASIAVFAGEHGRGTKNSVLDALAAGCPVVAAPGAVRGIPPGGHLVVAEATEIGNVIAGLLADPERTERLSVAARRFAASLPTWDDVAARYAELLRPAGTV